MNARRTAAVSRRIDAPVPVVWSLLTDLDTWSRWTPLTRAGGGITSSWRPLRYGRRPLRVRVSSPDAPFWVRVHVSAPAGRFSHLADVTLTPLPDGGTHLAWRATLTGGLADLTGRRRARLSRAVTRLAGHLAAYAEDPPTTRLSHADSAAAVAAARTSRSEPAAQGVETLAA
jgi:uncharacterized protein YndB with AHSA1/START domain